MSMWIICAHQMLPDNEIKRNEMRGAYSMHGNDENYIRFK